MKKSFLFMMTLIIGLMTIVIHAAPSLAENPTIGVAEFKNTSGAAWWSGGMGWELSGMVTSELASIGQFRVVERAKLEPVLREQNLAASGRVAKGTAASIGKLTGAQYLVMGTVTAYEESVKGTGGGFSLGPVSIGGKKEDAYISVDLRVVDTTTGEIVSSRAIEANAGGGGVNVGLSVGSFSGNMGGFEKTPAGKAVRACIVEIVEYLECSMIKKDSCLQEYQAKEQRRREKTKGAIKLDE
ncbi:MAG: CsgG/HfaB family protein [Desulfatirhabdiaceae bacterium]